MSTYLGKQAIVVGAGMGGLLAARVAADHFEHVTVLERDTLPADPVQRSGTPQARHVHALLGAGQRTIAEFFPGFEQDLAHAGAVPLQAGLDVRIERADFDPFPQRDLGWTSYSMSRPLIEFLVRRRLKELGNVTLREGCRVRALTASADGASVTGVRLDDDEALAADLVIDASGQGVPTLNLLDTLGRPRPPEDAIGVDIGYATALFEIPDDAPTGWKGVMTFPGLESSRGALMLPIEGGRWMLSVGGRYEHKPPGDPEGFMEFVRGLRTATIPDAVSRAKRLSDVARFGFPASVRRHFERVADFPRGLIPFADAVCRFNPVYGQGMSVAALEASLLGRVLARARTAADPLAEIKTGFLGEVQAIIEAPWEMSAIPDFLLPQTTGERPPNFEMAIKFALALTKLAARDPEVHKLNAEVQGLLRPRNALFEPALLQRVMAVMAEA